mgnify:FL=1
MEGVGSTYLTFHLCDMTCNYTSGTVSLVHETDTYKGAEMKKYIDALADTQDMEAPEFNEYLAVIQSKLDPENQHDCGGFASVFFSGIADDWATYTYETRRNTILEYIADQEIEIGSAQTGQAQQILHYRESDGHTYWQEETPHGRFWVGAPTYESGEPDYDNATPVEDFLIDDEQRSELNAWLEERGAK